MKLTNKTYIKINDKSIAKMYLGDALVYDMSIGNEPEDTSKGTFKIIAVGNANDTIIDDYNCKSQVVSIGKNGSDTRSFTIEGSGNCIITITNNYKLVTTTIPSDCYTSEVSGTNTFMTLSNVSQGTYSIQVKRVNPSSMVTISGSNYTANINNIE